jgi:glutamate--cysteine ligase
LRNSVDKVYSRRLAGLINSGERGVLRGGKKGVEKESLRVTPEGAVATSRHPRELGSALTNENVTTDYSEALIELVTPAFEHTWELTQYLCDIHQFVYRHLGDELLWATSMPCAVDGADEIGVPPRIGRALWPLNASDLGSAFQLFISRQTVVGPCRYGQARGG